MATIDQSRLLDLIGQCKVASVVVGIIALSLTASSYLKLGPEEYYLAILCIALIISVIFIVMILVGVIPVTDLWKKIDMVFHALMALLLAIGVVIQLVHVVKYTKLKKGRIATRVFAMIFGTVETALYGYIAWAIYKAPSV